MKLFGSNTVYDIRINYNDQFLFIHIPKTGGTSVVNLLELKSATHIKADEIFNSTSKKLLKRRFSFAIVRNPISRFISLYNYARSEISHYHNNIEPEKALHGMHLDYKLLKDATINDCVKYLIEGKLKHDDSWNHWEPQHTWLYDSKDNLLVQKVYKLENAIEFEKDFSIKLGYQIKLPKLNQSSSSKLIERQLIDLSKESLTILHNFYKKDFELLGY